MQSDQLRTMFFTFFKQHNHTRVPSSSLIPASDPTLLFTNAGMNQFKDVFLGTAQRDYTRAVSIQKCLRAGGKQSDIENVGTTKRHLTFFEMMGSFSFGDYFKETAIRLAWQFLTEQLELPAEHLYVSVYHSDDEAYRIWHDVIQIPANRIYCLGADENFWSMGATGPCGPCSEIHLDRHPNQPQEALSENEERFLEVWNLVFIEYNQHEDGTITPLEQKGIDTGMGLERLCTILQGVDSVFQTDLFAPLFKQLERITEIAYKGASEQQQTALCVLADHVRSTSCAIADGCTPSNEGRGYVLRKIIRRAALYGQQLNSIHALVQLAPTFIDHMKHIYPELEQNRNLIITLLQKETERFAQTLEHGQQILATYMQKTAGTTLTGEQAFTLYDTYGFPLELTQLIAEQHGYTVDTDGFYQALHRQKEQSKPHKEKQREAPVVDVATEFTGYQETQRETHITALIANNELVTSVPAGNPCWVITKQSPFYAESGGQVSDTGMLYTNEGRADVTDVHTFRHAIGLHIQAPHELSVGDNILLQVDTERRANLRAHHSATHLLQAALMTTLGSHIKQAGSLVAPDHLRFDVTHHEAIDADTLTVIENTVNAYIRRNTPLSADYMSYAEAMRHGALAFFGEKYPEEVRVVDIPGISRELCGGTHVNATGEIGCFKIRDISSLSAGIRRITAVAGAPALHTFQQHFSIIKELSQRLATQPHELHGIIDRQIATIKEQKQKVQKLEQQIYELKLPQWLERVQEVNGTPFGHIAIDKADSKALRSIANNALHKKPGCYMLTSQQEDGKQLFILACSPEYGEQIPFADLKRLLQEHGYKGGGKGYIMQGAAQTPEKRIGDIITTWLHKH